VAAIIDATEGHHKGRDASCIPAFLLRVITGHVFIHRTLFYFFVS